LIQSKVKLLSFGCVTHFIVQFIIKHEAQECDATKA